MGLAAAAKGLRQMGVGCAVLTDTKLTDDIGVSGDLVEGGKPTSGGHLTDLERVG
jgi:hypothetical protein